MATDLERLVVQLGADIRGYQRELAKAKGETDKQARAIERRFTQANARLSALGKGMARSLIAPLAGITAALGVREVLSYADAWTRTQNQLRVAGIATGDLASVSERLFQIAQKSGTAFEPTVQLFGRLSQSAAELGASQEELFQFTQGIGAALKVAGTDAAGASGALLQLSQALGGSIVRAEEFNSINEGARPILQAVAAGLDAAGGSVSKLRALVVDGKVTSQEFFRAFLAGSKALETQAASAVDTLSAAVTRIQNAFLKYIGQSDSSLGATQRLAQALSAIAGDFDKTADMALKLAAVIAGALVGRGIGAMLAVIPEAIVGIRTLQAALGGATIAAGGFRAALGPIGILIGAAAVAWLVFAENESKAEAATRSHLAVQKEYADLMAKMPGLNKGNAASLREAAIAHLANARAALADAAAQLEALEATQKRAQAQSPRTAASMTGQLEAQRAAVKALLADVAKAEKVLLSTVWGDEPGVAPPATTTPPPGTGGGGGAKDLGEQISLLPDDFYDAEAAARILEQRLASIDDLAQGFVSDLRAGLEDGMKFFDALADAASKAFARIADEAISQGVTEIVKLLFGGLGGTAGTAIASGVGQVGIGNLYDKGGYTGPGGKYQPAGVVHRGEYVFDKAAVDKIGVRNLELIRAASKRGYANGGPVGASSTPAIPKLPVAGGGGVTFAPSIVVNAPNAAPGMEVAIRSAIGDALAAYDRSLPVKVNHMARMTIDDPRKIKASWRG